MINGHRQIPNILGNPEVTSLYLHSGIAMISSTFWQRLFTLRNVLSGVKWINLIFLFFFLSFFFFNSGVKNHGWGIEWLCKIVWVLFKSYGHIWPWYRTLTDYVDRPINSWLTRQIELLWIHSSSISMGKLTQIFCIRIVKYCRRKKKKKSALPPTKNMKKNLCLTSRSFVSFHLQN